MKKPLIITGIIIAAFFLLFLFNSLVSKKSSNDFFAEVRKGDFEIAVSSAGELTAENSVEIKGPEMATGRDIRSYQIKIQDLIPEGTMVKKGDYIATLDRTELSNTLKDAIEHLKEHQKALELKLLDSAVQLNGNRDAITNQVYTVEETEMTWRNSKYESPSVIRQAEINYEQAKRVLDQRRRYYTRRVAQINRDINTENYWIRRMERQVKDLEEVLAGFTVTAPADGMVTYKREWRGNKRKAGSTINPMDRVVATLPDLSSLLSKTYINEIEISKIHKGQQVDIKVDAYPDKTYKGEVFYIANIGEKLPNTNDKVFEVLIKLRGKDPALRPSMTTGNKIIINRFNDAVYVPAECVQAGVDSIPFVYMKNGVKQIVIPGEANEKNIMIKKGLEAGSMVYLNNPENTGKFKLQGEELIPLLKEKDVAKNANSTSLLQTAY